MDNVIPFPAAKPTRSVEPLWREVVGEQLRAVRRERGERIVDVAGRAGVSPQYLSELERGTKDASSEVLAAVTGALGFGMLDLTARIGHRSEHRPDPRPDSRPDGRTGPGSSPRPNDPVCLAA